MLRTSAITAVAAVVLQFGLMAGIDHSAAAQVSIGFRVFSIPSTSMAPTLNVGDYVVALEWPKVSRGDVVVYRLPKDELTVYIKRVIGLPGDRVQMIGGVLHINGTPVGQERLNDTTLDYSGKPRPFRQWLETLPGGRKHRILDEVDNGFLDNTAEFAVPAGSYFMMGDNRDNSSDSRMRAQHGPVPAANIIGHPEFIYFSMQEGESFWRFWRWPWSVRWGRLFSRIG